ncbi:MAG TPA: alanine racemase [Tepidisphaeraceae bacterium]|nr:alanine racemase [Tepidisphaeraceae bacterium]
MNTARHYRSEPRLLINRSSLLHNLALIRSCLAPTTRVCAMVKADAYGHSAGIVADTLANFLTDGEHARPVEHLAVATIEEALALPVHDKPIHVFRPLENIFIGRQQRIVRDAIVSGAILTLLTPAAAGDLARLAERVGRRANVQVMLDTGMTRCGCEPATFEALVERVMSLPSLRLHSVCTHLATADTPDDPFVSEQLARFRSATDTLASRGVMRHAANSGGAMLFPDSHFDMVRPGISLYGIDATCEYTPARPLRPIAKWLAPIVAIHHVKAGTSVGYCRTFTAPDDTRIGVLPVGYADGYLRGNGNKGCVLVGDATCPVVGRVSMDLTTIDLANAPQAQIGDDAILMDDNPTSPASAYKLAEWMGSIPYEIFTRIGPRVKRVAIEPEDPPIAEEWTD